MQIPVFRCVTALVAVLVAAAGPALAQPKLYGAMAANGVDGPSRLVIVDPSSGATSLVGGPIGFDDVVSMDFHPDTGVLYATGKRLGTNTVVLLTIDTGNGQGSVVNDIIDGSGAAVGVTSIAFWNSPGPPLYAFGGPFGKSFGQIDRATGRFSVFGPSSGASPWMAMEFSPGNVLYAGTDGEGNLATLDASNGSRLGEVVVCQAGVSCSGQYVLNSLSFEPQSGTLHAVMNEGLTFPQDLSLVTVDPATGAFTVQGPLPDGIWALAWESNAPFNTPVGRNVQVNLPPADLTFDEITQAGNTSLSLSASGPPPPPGLALGAPPSYYDLTTTALFSGLVTACIDYNGVSYVDETQITLWHFEGPGWVDRTLSLDTANDIICAQVGSLSPFAIFEPTATTPDTTPPRLRVPEHVLARACRDSGAVVNYKVRARDDSDREVTVVCVPPSGSLFPIGATLVTCTATDFSGNSTQASFEVVVRAARRRCPHPLEAERGVDCRCPERRD